MKYLIAITTCNRINEVKKNIVPYLQFCKSNILFDFVLSLDGADNQYVVFCEQYNIPLIWSEEREGVGISKNRIFKLFPDYEAYFFIEDDVILYDNRIFNVMLELSEQLNIHHFSRTHTIGILKKQKAGKYKIIHSAFGDGSFLFYTGKSLQTIGGWHDFFIKYKRFGHTEHTYRVFHNYLNPSPFIFSRQAEKMIIVDTPPSVTKVDLPSNSNGIIDEEQDLINCKLKFVPFETPSKIFKNRFAESLSIRSFILPKKNHYDVGKNELKKAKSLLFFHKFKISGNPIFLFISLIYARKQKHLKNFIMIQWISFKENLRQDRRIKRRNK